MLLSMYIHLRYPYTSRYEFIRVMHVMVLNFNTSQDDGYSALSNKPYEGIDLLIKGFPLVPSMMGLDHFVVCSGAEIKNDG